MQTQSNNDIKKYKQHWYYQPQTSDDEGGAEYSFKSIGQEILGILFFKFLTDKTFILFVYNHDNR